METPLDRQKKWTDFLSKLGWHRPKHEWDPREAQQTLRWLNNSYGKGSAAMYHQRPSQSHPGTDIEGNHAVPFPTRLLDLGPHPGRTPRNLAVRLVVTNTKDRGHYVTLSHRWGDVHRLKLTTATLHALAQEGIDLNSLPRTYRDAVTVSRYLGFRYLWIDALCIVQDDERDWLQEAAKMASVYRNSSCTISTHAAYDDDEGFLHVRRRRQEQSISLLVTASGLSQRGWVFQERILSRRLLHFTAKGLFLEDASGFQNPDGSTPAMDLYNPWKDNKINLEDSHHDSCGWYRLIERFTACHLTYETDRLPAVLGLSKCLGEQLDDGHYLWGLWSRSIHQGLLWVNTDRNPKKLVHGPNSANGAAPSWSWGGWTGQVRFPDHVSSCKADCKLVGSEAGTEDGTTLWLLPTPHSTPSISLNLRTISLPDIKALLKHAPARFMGTDFHHSIGNTGLDLVSLDGERDKDVAFAQLTFAFVAHHRNVETFQLLDDADTLVERHTWVQYFLLLCPAGDDASSYRRVGMAASKGHDERPLGTSTSLDNNKKPIINPRARELFDRAELTTISLY